MTVTVNEQEMDFTLEREESVGEVLSGIEEWLESKGFSLTALILNGEEIAPETLEAVCARDLGEVQTIDIRACTWAELSAQAISSTLEMVEMAEKEGALGSASVAADWEQSAAASFLLGRDRELHSLVKASFFPNQPVSLDSVRTVLEERRSELLSPAQELAKLSPVFEAMAGALEEVPIQLQTGKDAAASETLHRFTSLAGKLLRLVPILKLHGVDLDAITVGTASFREYMEELSGALKELVSAYEGGDAVLVGDIAEYEIAPRLRNLCPAMVELTAV